MGIGKIKGKKKRKKQKMKRRNKKWENQSKSLKKHNFKIVIVAVKRVRTNNLPNLTSVGQKNTVFTKEKNQERFP